MKIIASADLHLSMKENNGSTAIDGFNTRLHDKLNALSQPIQYAIDTKADMYISLGDEFDSLNPPEPLRLKFIEALSPLFEADIPLIIIMGNHVYNATYYNLQSEERLLNLLGTKKMLIVSEPMLFEQYEIPFTFIPWSYINNSRTLLNSNTNRIIFHHMPIVGASLTDYEFLSKDGFTPDDLKKQLAWFGGHYHKHQLKDNYCYVGSLVKQDFGERNQEKGFLDINISEEIEYDFIEIKDRDFLQFDFTEPDDVIDYFSSINDIEGAVIKITMTGSNSWLYKINKQQIIKILQDKGAIRVLPPEMNTEGETRKKAVRVSDRSPFSDNIREYCKQKKKDNFEPIMQSILTEINNSEPQL